MLFVFDSSILNIDITNIRANRAIETLIGTFQNRNHLLFFTMKDLVLFRKKLDSTLSLSSRTALNELYNRLPEYKGLVDIIDHQIIVYIENESRNGLIRDNNKWYVPLSYFADSGMIETAILGENTIDAELFLIFAELFKTKKKIRGYILKARLISGGGSQTPKVLTSYLRNEFSPCLCITDSDKLHPDYKQSATSKNCKNAAKVKNRVVEYLSLEEREVENIIPHKVLEKTTNFNTFVSEINNNIIEDINSWKYIDLKHGVSYEWISKQNPETQSFWRKAAHTLGKKRKACPFCEQQKLPKKEECHCSTIPGLGEDVLSKTITYLNSNQTRINLRLFDADSRWEKIAKLAFEFSIAPSGEMVA